MGEEEGSCWCNSAVFYSSISKQMFGVFELPPPPLPANVHLKVLSNSH